MRRLGLNKTSLHLAFCCLDNTSLVNNKKKSLSSRLDGATSEAGKGSCPFVCMSREASMTGFGHWRQTTQEGICT